VSTGIAHSAGWAEKSEESKAAAGYDHTLVERLKKGDEAALAEIVERHREKLCAVAFSFLRDRHDAEEIVQDAFVRAFRAIGQFRGDSSLATWLHRITLNLARNRYWYFRRRFRHSTLSLDRPLEQDGLTTMGDLFADNDAGPSRRAATTDFSELVAGSMEKLLPRHREILTLRNILDCSYADIAAQLGINEGTVKSRIARARGCLRTLMATACPEFTEETTAREWLELDTHALAQASA
jgi:RNA polymerase sigma-70 factor, ECF subfamily